MLLILMVILAVLAANNVIIVPGWLLCIGWWLVAVRGILRLLLALFFAAGETGKP